MAGRPHDHGCVLDAEVRSAADTLEDAKRELDTLLQASVEEHMISDVPLGVWSSGGLDSSAVVHYAAQHHPALKTFSVSFPRPEFR